MMPISDEVRRGALSGINFSGMKADSLTSVITVFLVNETWLGSSSKSAGGMLFIEILNKVMMQIHIENCMRGLYNIYENRL